MEISGEIAPFWSRFLLKTGRDPDTPLYDAGPFGDREDSAETLARLVLDRTKVATASLLWEYEIEARRIPRPGDLAVFTDWGGAPLGVIETTAVEVRPFDEVDADFAAAEGEGDGSLAHWRRTHRAFFDRLCAELGREPSPRMPIVCERFRLAWPL